MENKHLSVDKLTLLHSIRGFAAFFVAICHSKWIFWVGGSAYVEQFPRSEWGIMDYFAFAVDMCFSNGTAMVMVFYVLSGFFISYSFQKNNWSLKEFYLNRFLRIYIPFLASMGVAYGAMVLASYIQPEIVHNNLTDDFNSYMVGSYKNQNLNSFLRNLLFLRTDGYYFGSNFVVWSLLFELIFYAIAPFVWRSSTVYLTISAMIFLTATFWLDEENFYKFHVIIRFYLKYSFYFALGMFLFDWRNRRKEGDIFPLKYLIPASILFLGLTLVGGVIHDYNFKGYNIPVYNLSLFFGALWGCTMILLFTDYHVKENFFIKALKYLGKISYSLYLIHFPTFLIIISLLWKFTGERQFYQRWYWLCLPFAVFTSSIFYYLIEDYSLKIISNWKKKVQQKHLSR